MPRLAATPTLLSLACTDNLSLSCPWPETATVAKPSSHLVPSAPKSATHPETCSCCSGITRPSSRDPELSHPAPAWAESPPATAVSRPLHLCLPARPSEFPPTSFEPRPGPAKAAKRPTPKPGSCLLNTPRLSMQGLRRFGPQGGPFVRAQWSTLRLKLLKRRARIKITTRRMWLSLSQDYPLSETFTRVPASLQDHPAWNPSGWPEGSCSRNIRFQARPAGRCTSTQDYQRPSGLPNARKIVLHFF